MSQSRSFPRRFATFALVTAAICTSVTIGAVTFDGQLGFGVGQEWGAPLATAVQDNYTQFGNQILSGYSGSELDELYVRTDGDYLYIGLSGNLEQNGNAQILMLDVRPGGQNVLATEIAPELSQMPCASLGPPFAVPNLGQALMGDDGGTPEDYTDDTTVRDPASVGTKLDAGFAVDYAIAFDTYGGTLYVTQYDLSDTANAQRWDDPGTNNGDVPCSERIEVLEFYTTRVFRGSVGVASGSGVLSGGENPNNSEFAYNNSGYAGVTGTQVAAAGSGMTGDPRTQTTGLEAKIALADLGFEPASLPLTGTLDIKVMAMLTAGDGYVSNQILPGIGGGSSTTSLGHRPDFTTYVGDQFAAVSRTVEPLPSGFILDGQNIVTDFDVSALAASQNTVTGFGDHPQFPDLQASGGSELNQMFAQYDQPNNALQVGITGNLERGYPDHDGNVFILFLDTVTGGESLLADNGDMLGNLDGDTIPMQADYALVFNIWENTAYLDLYDLAANAKTYIGGVGLGSGSGVLDNGGPVADWQLAIDNTNYAGVSDDPDDDPTLQQSNAVTAIKGFEFSIPLAAVGNPAPGSEVSLLSMVTGRWGWVSNQILPAGLGGKKDNYGDGPTDLMALGYQPMTVTVGQSGPVCHQPRFDADGDGDVDQVDFGIFQACMTGPGPGNPANLLYAEACTCFDWGGYAADGDIDQEDLGAFQLCAANSGPAIPADPTCDDPPLP